MQKCTIIRSEALFIIKYLKLILAFCKIKFYFWIKTIELVLLEEKSFRQVIVWPVWFVWYFCCISLQANITSIQKTYNIINIVFVADSIKHALLRTNMKGPEYCKNMFETPLYFSFYRFIWHFTALDLDVCEYTDSVLPSQWSILPHTNASNLITGGIQN